MGNVRSLPAPSQNTTIAASTTVVAASTTTGGMPPVLSNEEGNWVGLAVVSLLLGIFLMLVFIFATTALVLRTQRQVYVLPVHQPGPVGPWWIHVK